MCRTDTSQWVLILVGITLATAGAAAQAGGWTEDFADGVGPFTITIGDGDSVFAHDPIDENLSCTFIRQPSADLRLASVGSPLTNDDSAGFVVEWSPISGSLGAFPHIGFFDATTGAGVAIVAMTDNRYQLSVEGTPGVGVEDTGTDWFFGETYRLYFFLDGVNHSVTFATWEKDGDDFVFQGIGNWSYTTTSFGFDSLGVGNLVEENAGPTLVADIDNFSFIAPATPGNIYVNGESGNDAWDGRCEIWDGQTCGPTKTIQAAIIAAVHDDEIIVAPGTYNEVIIFLGKAITLRSSDGSDVTTIDGTGLNDSVVKCVTGEGADTVLEGFTITGGMGDPNFNPGTSVGGGMLNSGSSPTISNCIFTLNVVTGPDNYFGGGMYNVSSDPLITGCVFSENESLSGGGMFNTGGSSPTIVGCIFENHSIPDAAGIMVNGGSTPLIVSCIFRNNGCMNVGGGIGTSQGSVVTIINCLFESNSASNEGGGIGLTDGGSAAIVINSTFVGNSSNNGGGINNRGGVAGSTVLNSIFQDNQPKGL